MSAPGSRLVATGGERLVVGAALAVSLALVWLATGEVLLFAAFAAGVIALGGLAWVLARPKPVQSQVEYALPDWSVTVAAIDRPDCAVAITDRAGRLVCANRAFELWFTTAHAPPRLPVDNTSLERLAKAGRAGWRDGQGKADVIENESGRWSAAAHRAGRGDDYLVWTISPLASPDPVA